LETETFDLKKRQAEWLDRLTTDVLNVHKLMPVKLLPEDDYPQWLERVQDEIAPLMCPVAKVREGYALTPRRVGALLGHQCAFAVWMMEWIEKECDSAEAEAALTIPEGEMQQVPSLDKSLCEWYSALRKLAKRALCSSVDQTYEDMTDFLLGYTGAFARKPRKFGVGDIGGTNFEIYIALIMFRKQIENLKSVPELHDLLGKIMGVHRTGDLKRVEKICQRIGLHFRKPGRPKASK
jgi:hypothetical protein